MLFEEKAKEKGYLTYPTSQDTVYKRIGLDKSLAEEINKVISVVNKESGIVQINNSILGTLAFNCFFKQLEALSEDDAIKYIRNKALDFVES